MPDQLTIQPTPKLCSRCLGGTYTKSHAPFEKLLTCRNSKVSFVASKTNAPLRQEYRQRQRQPAYGLAPRNVTKENRRRAGIPGVGKNK